MPRIEDMSENVREVQGSCVMHPRDGFSHAPGSSLARKAAARGQSASSGREASKAQLRWAKAHLQAKHALALLNLLRR